MKGGSSQENGTVSVRFRSFECKAETESAIRSINRPIMTVTKAKYADTTV